MSAFPSAIFSPRTIENKSGVVYDPLKKTVIYADDFQNLANEIVAIQTALGLWPQQWFTDVAEAVYIFDYRISNLEWPQLYFASVYRSGAVNFSADTYNTIQLNAEAFDVGSRFNTGTYKYIVPANGYYRVDFQVYCSGLTAGNFMEAMIYIDGDESNGIIGPRQWYAGGSYVGSQGSKLLYLTTNKEITLRCYVSGACALQTGKERTYLTVQRIY